MKRTTAGVLLLFIFVGALSFRALDLGLRPMHHDEANQAVKLGLLLEKGEYRYDPADHHGPTLYYLSLPVARAFGRSSLAALDERTLRFLPALLGAALVLLLGLFRREMDGPGLAAAALLLAVSPAFVYYARFYIQETLLVFFTAAFLGSLWTYRRRRTMGWAVAAGTSAGMMFATKETSIILLAAAAAAYLLAGRAEGAAKKDAGTAGRTLVPARAWAGIAAAIGVAALFYSSFLAHPKGVLDSVLAFRDYFAKGGSPGFHAHPAGYYLGLLTWSSSGGLAWSESLILALAFLGIVGIVRRRSAFGLFISAYSMLTAAAFSLIPYKTPWNLLPFHFGFVVLAGFGISFLAASLKRAPLRAAAAVLLLAGAAQLGAQAYAASFRYPADPRNPYAYAQTGTDYLKLARRIEDIAGVAPEGRHLPIAVVCDPHEMWPLPWTLRRFDRVGYWTNMDRASIARDVALVIASRGPAEKIEMVLKDAYRSEYYGLRPEVLLTVFIRRDLWDRFMSLK